MFLLSTFLFKKVDYAWSLISAAFVLSPEGNDVMELALTRFKGNVIGSIAGLIILALGIQNPFNMIIGSVLALLICDLLKLNLAARSTLAAMIITLLHKEGTHLWDAALSRIVAVVAGSVTAMLVTFTFHYFFKIKFTDPAPATSDLEKKEEKS